MITGVISVIVLGAMFALLSFASGPVKTTNLPLFIRRLIHGGSNHLSAIEIAILDAVRGHLAADESLAIGKQIREIETVQKSVGGRIVMVWYRRSPQSRQVVGDEFCLARLRIEEDGRMSAASVWIGGGRVQSFEYSRRPRDKFSVRAVEIRPQKVISTAKAVDRLEHPDEERG